MKNKFISKGLFVFTAVIISLVMNSGIILNSAPAAKAVVDNSIDVVSPNGGEVFNTSDTITVQWTMNGIIGPAGQSAVWLMKSGAYTYLIKDYTTASNNSVIWTIPSNLQTGSDYKIRVISGDYTAIYDESDNYFIITQQPAPSIRIGSPNGGESWIKGGTYNITWASAGVSNVSIILIWDTPSGLNSTFIATLNTNPGIYAWTIPSSISTGTSYRVRIFSGVYNTGNIVDDSDSSFSINDLSMPATDSDSSPDYVKYPINLSNLSRAANPDLFVAGFGRGIYAGTSNIAIHYVYGQSPNPLIPKLTGDAFDTYFDFCTSENNIIEAYVQADGRLSAHGIDLQGTPYKCVSGALVERNYPNIKVNFPNGGEQWELGKDYVIAWNSGGIANKIISFYKGGKYLKEIRTTGDGLVWKVDPSFAPGNDYSIKISDESYKFFDDSDSYFSVTVPEGAIIQAYGDVDVYIVKYAGNKKFKRLVLSPSVFRSYGHLKWENLIKVDKGTLDSFMTSSLVRSANSGKTYLLIPNGDSGERRLIGSMPIFYRMGYDIDSVYEINGTDEYSYSYSSSRDFY